MTDKTKAILVIVVGSIIGGAVSSVTKIGLVKIPPFSFSFIRFFIASTLLLPFFLKAKVKFDKSFRSLILLSLLPTFNVALFVLGVKTTTASIGQMLYAGTPILAGIFGFLLFKNRLTLKKWLYILIGLLGVFLVIIFPLLQKNTAFAGDLKGNILISIGVILWSLYFVYSKQFQKKYSPLIMTSLFIFVATVVFFLLAFLEIQNNFGWWQSLKTSSIIALLYVSIFGTVLNYLLNQYAIKFGGPILASLSFYLLPIFAYLSAFILLGERITIGLIIGTILVFISVALTTYAKY